MKHLTIIRHAKSSWKEVNQADIDRPLNKRGKHDALLMAKIIAKKVEHPDIVLCSPAKRARKTAKAIAQEIRVVEEIYDADVDVLVQIVSQIEDRYDRAFLIGHNPSLTALLSFLTPAAVGSLPTCAAACVELGLDSWKAIGQGVGSIIYYDSPRNHQ